MPRSRLALADASDSVLVARAADGDTDAFEILARRHGPLMRAYAVRVLGSDVESDDVVQETFVLAWQRMGEVTGSVRSWLMRIVTNKAIDRIRVRKQHADIDDWDAPTPSNQSPAQVVEVAMQMDALSSALQRLPEQQRRCWIMKEVGGSSYAEIAEDLSLPVSTVRGQLARARQTLVIEMEGWR
jgi:RNA polymerase sigma-70 factor (ECF subfamily)